ncbi:MAG: DUF3108 domain-containing protein [Alphaproteobacteria bacterium]|nr:MAG: DUF3108 domain-containing protein [Alphaproteobacteria bacterium]TAF14930.1 MAG: DUF3108 domain-containing protein [Alphaproteobacteria bacterium]TAF41884.1 MAG: DUF3108 domain-containing protein [Alphaproteobacteria bacterium]TAF77209.1 MAG: DUF3108 domain-containing protein [Alphaproteobacteria bacterium]
MVKIILWMVCILVQGAFVVDARAITIAQPVTTERASYRIYYTGIPIGTVVLWREVNDGYEKITASVKTTGLLRVFNKQKRTLEVMGKHHNGVFTPIMYEARVEYPHKKRLTTISYDAGAMREVLHTPELLPRDEISLDKVGTAYDPLTSAVYLLHFMADASLHHQPFATKIFDGKRLLMGYAFPHLSKDAACVAPCRAYQLSYKPLLGYDAEEQEDARKQRPLVIHYHREQSYFPLSLIAKGVFGKIEVRRVKED